MSRTRVEVQHRTSVAIMAALVFCVWSFDARAQNTSGVFSPVVKEGDRSMQYRLAYDTDAENFAHRFHYQQSLDSQWRWRMIVQARETASSDFDFNYLRGELMWDITDANASWQTGMRFEARIRDRGRPGDIGVHWTNLFKLSPEWEARLIGLTSLQIGDGARDGIGISTRASIARRISDQQKLGLEMFSSYGTLDDLADFDDQSHQLGPFTSLSLDGGWTIFGGALLGLTDAASDAELRFWLTRSF